MNTDTMWAMALEQPRMLLRAIRMPVPEPGPHEVLIHVSACGVCRTDLHIADGDLAPHRLPLVPGHEAVGTVVRTGSAVSGLQPGDRVGVPWLGATCGHCRYCLAQRENLCDDARFTGYDLHGGYAEYMAADARYCFRLPANYDPVHLAPLLCAGLIGYRAYSMAGEAECLGLYGFGAAAHLIAQVARHQGRRVFAFTRPGDLRSQQFALSLGAEWAGGSDSMPPVPLDAAILFAPAGALVPASLAALRKGGTVVCAGIHMSDIPGFPYSLLWGERSVRSVANLTRADGEAFFEVAQQVDLHTAVVPFSMKDANRALSALRAGEFDGAAVLVNDF
jgi:propanol-preferring alcohol dehydrogenase